MTKQPIQPAWLTLRGSEVYTGLSARTILRRADEGLLEKTYATGRDAKRGPVLISRASIDTWLGLGANHTPVMAAGMNGAKASAPEAAKRGKADE